MVKKYAMEKYDNETGKTFVVSFNDGWKPSDDYADHDPFENELRDSELNRFRSMYLDNNFVSGDVHIRGVDGIMHEGLWEVL